MANARQFSVLYDIVGRNAQDESPGGDTDARDAINETIRQLLAEFDVPQLLLGFDGGVTVTPTATTGPMTLSLAADVKTVVSVWYTISGVITRLGYVKSQDEWLKLTDTDSDGDPALWRFLPQSGATAARIQAWPGASASWLTNATNLKYAYWGQLTTLSADADVPALPFEQDIVLVSGGSFYMALQQPDTELADYWSKVYERDKQNFRAWVTSGRHQDVSQLAPVDALAVPSIGAESKDYGRLP